MKNTKIRLITDTAIGAALCSLLLIITMYVPFIRVFGVLVCGTPFMYLACKRGVVSTITALLIALITVTILTGNLLTSILLVVSYALPGFAFSIAVSKKMSTSALVLITSGAVLLGFLIELVIMSGDGIRNFMNEMMLQMSQTVEDTLSSLTEGAPENLPSLINKMLSESVEVFMRFLPAVFIITAFGYGYITSAFGAYFLKRMQICDIKFRKFYEIRAPKFISNMIFIFYIVSLIGDSRSTFIMAIDNIVLVSAAILGFCGLSVIDYYFRRKIEAGVARFVIYIAGFVLLSAIMPFAVTLLPMVGYIDSKGIMRRELEEK